MTKPVVLGPGEGIAFYTRPAGMKTYLYAKAADDGPGKFYWHIELCCKDNHDVTLGKGEPKGPIDISEGAGSIASVHNTGWYNVSVWTDV